MARYGDNQIEEVRSRADIVEIIGSHVRLRKAGRNWVGLCPFHNEKTPSFSVNAERGFFYCFGCGVGGTVFNFLMRVEGLTFPEVVRSLAHKYGVALPETDEHGPARGEREAMLRANELAAEFFEHVLWSEKTPAGAATRAYLKSRGLSVDTSRHFRIGYAPASTASLATALDKRGLGEAGLRLGLIKQDENGRRDMFRARVMFPIRDAQGRVVAFGGRVLDDRQPKYLNSPESPLYSKTRTLYGIYEARQTIQSKDRVILVEGYFDVIALWQAGFKEVVAGCGTALTVDQLRILSRFTKDVLACFDGDSAGRKASLRALEIFLQAGLLGRGIFIPQGFDPDTFIRDRGAQAFEELIGSAELLIDYFVEEQAAGSRGSVEKRSEAARRIAAILKQVGDPFQFDMLARKAADALGVDEKLLRDEGRKAAPRAVRDTSRRGPVSGPIQDGGAKAEIGLVALAMLSAALRPAIAESSVRSSFEDPLLAELLEELCRLGDAPVAIDQFMAERVTAELQGSISAIAVATMIDDEEKMRALVGDYIAAIERKRRQREVENLKRSAIAAGERDADDATAAAQAVIALRREARTER
jgi:DNA primase